MLSKFDDYPIHQTPAPIAHRASADRNVYDRYWFNGYQEDGEFYFGIASGLYPNLGILDGAFSIVADGEQHSFHASRRAPDEPTDVHIGPFSLEILEPMRSLRLVIDDNDTGIAAELTFTARTGAVEEGRQTIESGIRTVMDVTRFAQFGRWEGEVRYAGNTVRVDRDVVYGTKDRSWGVRGLGVPDPGLAPSHRSGSQLFFLWAPTHWADRCTHVGLFETGAAQRWHTDGVIVPAYEDPSAIPGTNDPAAEKLVGVEHDLEFVPGTRLASHAVLTLHHGDGRAEEIEMDPLLCFRMKGIGYMHPEWGHGVWKDELAYAGEWWREADLEPMAFENQHIQQVMRARSGDDVGVGVLEQNCWGPHSRYGWTDYLDPS